MYHINRTGVVRGSLEEFRLEVSIRDRYRKGVAPDRIDKGRSRHPCQRVGYES